MYVIDVQREDGKFLLKVLTGFSPGRRAGIFGKGEASCIALHVCSIIFIVRVYSCISGVIF